MPSTPGPEYSLVVPVYKNEESLRELLAQCAGLAADLDHRLELIFVVDGSPDASLAVLRRELPAAAFPSQLIVLSRNFGSFSAIRAGLAHARGAYLAVMAADLQEPPELIRRFFDALKRGEADVTIGTRTGRSDPPAARLASNLFWALYRRFVQPEMPPGGVDVFGCSRPFRDTLLSLRESHSSLVGLVFWVGFRRALIPYERRARRHGRSAWSLGRRITYLLNSVFSFTDFPIRVLIWAGLLGFFVLAVLSLVVLAAKLSGLIAVPGYAATILTISFFAALNSFGLGIIGSYIWRTFENTKGRPDAVVMSAESFPGGGNG